jgi:hypothetical protein
MYIETECKFVLWCKISKLICREAVILGIVYIPPEYTSYSSPDAFGQIETEYMQLITNYKNIVLVGDFNARTAEEKDYIFLEDYEFGDDLQGISINEVCNLDIFGIPCRRTSKDKGKNRYGNFLLDFCKGNNVFIMNGLYIYSHTAKYNGTEKNNNIIIT